MGKLKLIQEMEDGESKDKSNTKMIQELWNTQMTMPENGLMQTGQIIW